MKSGNLIIFAKEFLNFQCDGSSYGCVMSSSVLSLAGLLFLS